MTPFGIAILALTTVYIIPLVTSPRGRGIARDGMARAQELSNAAVDQASIMAQDGKVAVSNMTSRAQDTATNLTSKAQDTATNLTSRAQDTAGNLRQRAGNMVPGMMQSNTQNQSKNASDVTSSVPHSSSEPTQARDVSSKYPKNDMSFEDSKDMASKATRDMSHSFDKSSKSSFNTSDSSAHSTGFSQSAVQGFSEPSKASFSHGPSDASNMSSYATTTGSNILSGNDNNMPEFAQSRKSVNYSESPHTGASDLKSTNMIGNQAPAGKRPSIDDGDYSIQNKMGQGSEYQQYEPRGAPNRGMLGTGTAGSMGKMPIGELVDEKNQAGEKAPPLSAGGLNAMK